MFIIVEAPGGFSFTSYSMGFLNREYCDASSLKSKITNSYFLLLIDVGNIIAIQVLIAVRVHDVRGIVIYLQIILLQHVRVLMGIKYLFSEGRREAEIIF